MAVNYFRLSLISLAIILSSYLLYDSQQPPWWDGQQTNRQQRAATPAPPALINPSPGSTQSASKTISVEWPTSYLYSSFRLVLVRSGSEDYEIKAGLSGSKYEWRIPALLSGSAELRVMVTSTTDKTEIVYASSTFKISAIVSDSKIKITAPTATADWTLGSQETISFTYSGSDAKSWGAEVYSYSSSSPLFYGKQVTWNNPMNSLNANVDINPEWLEGKYTVVFYVVYADGSYVTGKSDDFNIFKYEDEMSPTPDRIEVTAPTFGQEAFKTKDIQITWTAKKKFKSFNIDLLNHNSDLYPDQKKPISSIATQISKDAKSYTWKVPTSLSPSRYYYVRVYGALEGKEEVNGVAYSKFFTIKTESGKEDVDLEPACTQNCLDSPVTANGNMLVDAAGYGGNAASKKGTSKRTGVVTSNANPHHEAFLNVMSSVVCVALGALLF